MRARVNGVELAYEVHGKGLPLLFIHGGYGGAAGTVLPQRPPIVDILPPDSVQTITYDRRNCGQSEYMLGHYTLEDLAEDARMLLEHLDISRAVIVGSSAGGPIALQFALAFPEMVQALCLPNTGPNLMSEERPVGRTRKELVERSRREGDRAVFESRKEELRRPPDTVAGNISTADAEKRRSDLAAALASLSDEDLFRYATGEVRNFEAYIGYDFTSRLGEIKKPVCIIHGTADTTVPIAWGQTLHDGIAGSEFHAIEGAAHGVLTYPAAAPVLRDWVERVASAVTNPG